MKLQSRSLCDLCKGVKSLGKEGSARGEEPLFKAVCSSRIFFNEDFVLRTTSVSPLDRDKDTVLDPRKMRAHFSAIKNLESTSDVRSTKQEPLRFMQRRQKFREREECEGRRTAFQSGLLLSRFFIKRVSCSARPASRRWTATRTQSLTREKCVRIFPYKDFSLNICCEITPPLRHHPDILFRAVQAEHHLRSAFRPFFLLSHEPSEVLNRISKHFQSVPVEEYAY